MARRIGAEDVIVHALNNIGATYCQGAANWEAGFELLQESLQRAFALSSPADVCRAYFNLAAALHRRSRYPAAIDWMEQLRAYATTVSRRDYANLALWRLMWMNWDIGRWSSALAYRDQLAEFGAGLYATWASRVLAWMSLDLGRIEEARQILEERLPMAIKANDLQTTTTHLGGLIRIYSATGQPAEAAGAVRSLLECLAQRPYPLAECIMPLFFACQYLGGHAAAATSDEGRTCLSHLERLDGAVGTEESRAGLAEARGTLLLAAGGGRAGEAAEHLRQAAADWQTIERGYDQARALGSLGRALKAAGDTAGAKAAHAQGLDIVKALAAELDEALRASFLASPLVRELRQAAGSAAPGREFAGLTEREIEVLRLVAQGLTNVQIAANLVVSPLTVNAHLRSIFNKLDVTRRAAAARFAVEHGLV